MVPKVSVFKIILKVVCIFLILKKKQKKTKLHNDKNKNKKHISSV